MRDLVSLFSSTLYPLIVELIIVSGNLIVEKLRSSDPVINTPSRYISIRPMDSDASGSDHWPGAAVWYIARIIVPDERKRRTQKSITF